MSRDKQTFRDDRLIIVACDDTYAPKQYFGFFRFPRVHVHVVETTDGTSSAEAVLTRLLEYEVQEEDERWLLLDTDHYIEGPHITSFRSALRKAKQQDVRVALSRPCFELWALLHHVDETQVVSLRDCTAVTSELRRVLGAYNKTRLIAEDYPIHSIIEACTRAKRLDSTAGGGEIPAANSSRVFEIWRTICDCALPSQLPEELRDLVRALDGCAQPVSSP